MRDGAPKTFFRQDYQSPSYEVSKVAMVVDIRDGETFVDTELTMNRRDSEPTPLVLNGEDLGLLSIAIDGVEVPNKEFTYDGKMLII